MLLDSCCELGATAWVAAVVSFTMGSSDSLTEAPSPPKRIGFGPTFRVEAPYNSKCRFLFGRSFSQLNSLADKSFVLYSASYSGCVTPQITDKVGRERKVMAESLAASIPPPADFNYCRSFHKIIPITNNIIFKLNLSII